MSTLVDFLYLSQLWPPPEALELVRSTFVPRFPPLEERGRLIFVTRKPSQSRSIVNEQDVIRTLQDVCGRTGLQLQGTATIGVQSISSANVVPISYARTFIHSRYIYALLVCSLRRLGRRDHGCSPCLPLCTVGVTH
jgi:hypothetical protein